MRRRKLLAGVAGMTGIAVAGCTNPLAEDDGNRPSVPEDRSNRVYVPSHRDEMEMTGMQAAGEYRVGLMYTYPHRFWTVSGSDTERVDIREQDAVHLMATLFDEASGTTLPIGSGVNITIERDGELVAQKPPWPMISQSMGFHYGDNYALDGDGTYDVTVDVSDVNAERFGAFEGRFDERAETTFEIEYSTEQRDSLEVRQFPDKQGDPGAASMMEMGMMPLSTVPEPDELPGRVVGEGTSGDATFLVAAVESAPFAGDGGTYLLVSPRTPYNRVPLPLMSLSATLARDGETVQDGPMSAGLAPDVGYHYGVRVGEVASGDDLTITVDSPPQMSRHEGYETAFLDMPAVELTLE